MNTKWKTREMVGKDCVTRHKCNSENNGFRLLEVLNEGHVDYSVVPVIIISWVLYLCNKEKQYTLENDSKHFNGSYRLLHWPSAQDQRGGASDILLTEKDV